MEAWSANWDYRAIVERHFDKTYWTSASGKSMSLRDMTAMETSRKAGGEVQTY
jgi:hypothetical protein